MNKEKVKEIRDKIEKAHSDLVPKGVTLAWSSLEENLEWQQVLDLADAFLSTFPVEEENE